MLKHRKLKGVLVETICIMYGFLLIYAAASKLLDYNSFRLQLGQSPMLSAFAGWIWWLVPAVEILIALLLFVPRLRLASLFASYMLMCMFTAYIYILLNYSSFVPCSCGGILEKLTWSQHMLFNIAFAILAVIAIILYPQQSVPNTLKL